MSQTSENVPAGESAEEECPPMIKEAIAEKGWGDPIVAGSPPASVFAQGSHSFYQIELTTDAVPPLLSCLITGPEAGRRRRRSLIEAINYANVQLLMGHFQVDPATEHLQYRIVLPLHHATVGVETVELLGYFGLNQFDRFLPRFQGVVDGEISPWEAIWDMEGDPEEAG